MRGLEIRLYTVYILGLLVVCSHKSTGLLTGNILISASSGGNEWELTRGIAKLGHSRKHPYHPQGGNWNLTLLPPSDVLIHLLLSETIFSPPPPPPDGRNFLREGSVDLFWNDSFLYASGVGGP